MSQGRSSWVPHRAVRAVALVEAAKGGLVLVVASGVLLFVHEDLNSLAVDLVRHLHLNPASRYPHIFLDAVADLPQPGVLWLAAGATAYALLRFVEAYGLYYTRAWAEWLAALSGAVYLPFEVIEIVRKPALLAVIILAINLGVVAVMAWALVQRHRAGAPG